MQFIDIHTHQNTQDQTISIKNIVAGKDNIEFGKHDYYSVGIHPWYHEDPDKSKFLIAKYATNPHVLAIGECGIDLSISTSLKEQFEIFIYQARLADEIQKPLIIHCVKAYNEVLKAWKTVQPSTPWIMHGFNANKIITEEFIKNGIYISLGESLFYAERQITRIINELPPELLFFETDESKHSISEIYNQYSQLTGIEPETISKHIYANFARVFNIKVQNNE